MEVCRRPLFLWSFTNNNHQAVKEMKKSKKSKIQPYVPSHTHTLNTTYTSIHNNTQLYAPPHTHTLAHIKICTQFYRFLFFFISSFPFLIYQMIVLCKTSWNLKLQTNFHDIIYIYIYVYIYMGCVWWTLSSILKFDRLAILNKSWQQHPTRHQLYGHLPPITKTIQVRQTRHAGHCWRSRDELISDVLLWTPHMAGQKQDDQLEHAYSSYVRIRDVALKTNQRRWTIGRSGERGSGISVLAARYDDHDDDDETPYTGDLFINCGDFWRTSHAFWMSW